MASTNNASVFEAALVQFKSGLKKKDQDNFKNATLQGLLNEIENIQTAQHSKRRGENLGKLKPFIEAMDQFGKVIEVFGNTNVMVAFVWGPTKFLLQIAATYSDAFHELVDMYAELGESLPLLLRYEDLFRGDSNMQKVLAFIYKDILEFHRLALKYFQQPMWKQLWQATWKTHKSRFQPLIDDIRGHGNLVQAQATASQIEQYQKETAAQALQIQSITDTQEMQRLRELISWLGAPNVENDQYHYSKVRDECPGTGRWLLDIQVFKEWIDPRFPTIPPLLWMTGMPGAGKTILTSLVVEEVRKLSPAPITLFFYCKNGDEERNNFVSIGRSFLAQLLSTSSKDILLPFYWDKFSSSTEPVLSTYSLVETMLEVTLLNCPSVYIALDGIDECPRDERKRISRWFRNLVENLQPPNQDRVRCLFVSQDDGIARKDFRGLTSLKIENKHNRADIEVYSSYEAAKIQTCFGLSEDIRKRIGSKIQCAADGMFLLAKLISINLLQQTSVADLEDELEDDRMPKELSQVYSRILHRLLNSASASERAASETLLRWLVRAKRPLRWHEIQAAKSIHVESQSVDLERRRFRVDSKDLCGSLVEIREDGRVEFVHTTAKLFLVDSPQLDVSQANISLASLAIDYLNMAGFHSDLKDPRHLILQGYYGFMDYAVAYWVRHLEEGANEAKEDNELLAELAESLETFLQIHYSPSPKEFPISQGNAKRLRVFQRYPFHDSLQQAVASMRKELTFYGEMKQNETAVNLTDIAKNIRDVLEDVCAKGEQTGEIDRMKEMYGRNLFKCPRLSCRYFCDGFSTAAQRDRHFDKHLRPFRCTIVGCPTNTFGMASKNDLEKHMKETHKTIVNDDFDFPEDEEILESKRVETQTTREDGEARPVTSERPRITEFPCPDCQKIFKKKYNLESHLKTHSNDRPHSCYQCDATFAREHDVVRHEKTHKEKEFICGGVLENGQRWGCQKKFARSDTLQSHYKTASGQACVPPMTSPTRVETRIDLYGGPCV
ncbi:hypothetical protein GGR54DRAFT_483461 [Hypoxylon sp. NC1633]|nr:hypothetical protein GGR54DRAFT_483461 [Hypoxylon sp. NC1633]